MSPFVAFSGLAKSGKDTAAEALCKGYNGVAVAFADPIKRFLMKAYAMDEARLWGDKKEEEFQLPFAPEHNELVDAFHSALVSELSEEEFFDEYGYTLGHWAKDYSEGDWVSGRKLMQTFGTECVRQMDPNLWWKTGLDIGRKLLTDNLSYAREKGVYPRIPGTAQSPTNLVCFTDARFRNELLAVKEAGGLAFKVTRPWNAQAKMTKEQKAHASETEQTSIPDWWYDGLIVNDDTVGTLQDRTIIALQRCRWSK